MVGGFKHGFYFPFHIWDVILPIDELILFKMVKTTNQTRISCDLPTSLEIKGTITTRHKDHP